MEGVDILFNKDNKTVSFNVNSKPVSGEDVVRIRSFYGETFPGEKFSGGNVLQKCEFLGMPFIIIEGFDRGNLQAYTYDNNQSIFCGVGKENAIMACEHYAKLHAIKE